MGRVDRSAWVASRVSHRRYRTVAWALALFGASLAPQAWAHEAEEPEAAWFNSLKTESGISCCDQHHDCDYLDSDQYTDGDEPGSYKVRFQGEVVPVPASAVLRRDNPTGHAVMCVMFHDGHPVARCFVPPSQG